MKTFIFLSIFIAAGCATDVKRLKKPYLWEVRRGEKVSYILGTIKANFTREDLYGPIVEKIKSSSYFMWSGENLRKRGPWVQAAAQETTRADVVNDWLLGCSKEIKDETKCEYQFLPREKARRIDEILNLFYDDKEFLYRASKFPFVFDGIPRRLFDIDLMNLAQEHKIPIVELDANEQYWQNYGPKITKEFLYDYYEHEEKIFEKDTLYFRRSVRRYNTLLERFLSGDFPISLPRDVQDSKEYKEMFLEKRTDAWEKSFFHLFDRGNVFMVADLQHIDGEHGVLEKLSKSGYYIRRVRL